MSSGTRPYRVMIHHQNPIVRLEKEAFFPGIVGIGMGEALNSHNCYGGYVSPLGWRQFPGDGCRFRPFIFHVFVYLFSEFLRGPGSQGDSCGHCHFCGPQVPWISPLGRAPTPLGR